MKSNLLVGFIFFSVCAANAQYSFRSDLKYSTRDITHLDSIFNIESVYDFQLRVWTGGGLLPTHSLFVFTVKKDSLAIRYFRLQKTDSIGTLNWAETFINNVDVPSFWTYINARHVRELPSMKQIFKKHKIEEGRTYDGTSYWIEIFSKNGTRGSQFYCPKSNFRNYPNAIEFKWVTEIIEAVYNLVGEHWGLCKTTTANMEFGKMPALEYMLSSISLLSFSPSSESRMSFGI